MCIQNMFAKYIQFDVRNPNNPIVTIKLKMLDHFENNG